MKVSVIVSTYNGAHKLPNVLQSLLEQTIPDFELIVVVDGSTDDTPAVLHEWLPKFRDAKSILLQHSGRSKVRNAGAKSANGDLLFFVDDDMRLEHDCLEAHIHHHERFPDSLASGAQIYDEKKATSDFQRYKCLISRNWCADIQKSYPQALPPKKIHLTAANFSVSRPLFENLGMFDESLNDMEDFLLAYKAMQNNIPVYYLHRALGWHDDFADIYAMQNRYVQYKKTAIAVAQRFPELQTVYPRYAVRPATWLRKTGNWFFTKRPVIAVIDNNKIIPEKLRYRLYGIILHAREQLLNEL
jgi:glycosyltransferase involved in cell wall biosynthesis